MHEDPGLHLARRLFALFVGDRSDSEAMIHIARNRTESSSVSRDFASHYGGATLDSRKVPTIALNDLLARAKIGRVDFLSTDIELSAPQALAGFG